MTPASTVINRQCKMTNCGVGSIYKFTLPIPQTSVSYNSDCEYETL